MSSSSSEARQNIVGLITKYLNSDDTDESTVSNEILYIMGSSEINTVEINNIFWTFFTLCKSVGIFCENAIIKMANLVSDFAAKKPELVPLVYLCLDVADSRRVAPGDFAIFGKGFKASSEVGKSMPRYKFQENPEGYSRLLCAFLQKPIPNLRDIVGEHNLNLDCVLNVFLDIVGAMDPPSLYQTLQLFPLEKVVKVLMQKIGKGYKPDFDDLLFYLFDSGVIPENQMDVMVKRLAKLMDQLWAWLDRATTEFCEELRKPITVWPGETKEDSYSDTYKERRANYRRAQMAVHRTPKFRYLLSRLSIHEIRKMARFDPCSVPAVAEFVLAHLKEELERDRENFLSVENMELLCMLSCHCRDNKFITTVAKLENVPPHIYSFFILPCLVVSDCAWQVSFLIKESLDRFTLPQKCQIFQKYAEAAEKIVDLRILTAKTAGATAKICKRLTEESAKLHALKVATLLLRAPHVVGPAIIQNFIDNNAPTDVPVAVLSRASSLGVEMILWTLMETIKQKRIPHPNGTSISSWPQEIAVFMGRLISQRYQEIDLKGILSFIEIGLSQGKLEYVCLFGTLITQLTDVRYRGDLTKNDIELRSGSGLLRINRIFASRDRELEEKTYMLKKTLSGSDDDDTHALRILSYIDAMHNKWFLSRDLGKDDAVPDKLDKIRFVFLTCCELLDGSKLSLRELVNQYGYSLPAALHLARGNSESETESFSPPTIPPELFRIFWDCYMGDLHVPESTFTKWEQKFDEEIAKCKPTDEEKQAELELRKAKLQMSKDEQLKRVEEMRKNLAESSNEWFDLEKWPDIYVHFVEHCVLPRALISSLESIYCYKFIYTIANFSSSFNMEKLLEAIVKPIQLIPFAATHEELMSFGRFVRGLLKVIKNRQEERPFHDTILAETRLLLDRPERWALGNTVGFLVQLGKYFPKYPEHRTELLSMLDALDVPEDSDVGLRLKKFKSLRMEQKPKAVVVVEAPVKEPEPVLSPTMTKSRSKPVLSEKPPMKPAVHSDEERPVKARPVERLDRAPVRERLKEERRRDERPREDSRRDERPREDPRRDERPREDSRRDERPREDSRRDERPREDSRRGLSPVSYGRGGEPGYGRHDRSPPYDRRRERSPVARSRDRTPPKSRDRTPPKQRDRRERSPSYDRRAGESRYHSGRR